MRTHRLPVALLAALAATAVAAGASAQPADPPADTPVEAAPEGTENEPGAGEEAPAAEGEDAAAPEGEETTAPEATEPAEPPPPPKPSVESNCTDGVDEDGDGVTDCADADCQTNPACAPPPPPPAPAAAPAAAAPAVADDPQVDKKTDDAPPPDTTLGLEAMAGVTGRIGSISSGYDASERAGMQYGAGILFAPNRQFAFGLRYIYSGLGAEEFDPSINDTSGKIRRRLHNAAALFRAYPLRSDTVGLWAGLNVGLTWQTAAASGSIETGNVASPAVTYQADAGPQAGLALGAGLGMDVDLSRDLGMLASLNFTNHRLTSDVLEGDAGDPEIPGIGSVSQVDFRLAFQYRFDLAGTSSPVSASVQTGSR